MELTPPEISDWMPYDDTQKTEAFVPSAYAAVRSRIFQALATLYLGSGMNHGCDHDI